MLDIIWQAIIQYWVGIAIALVGAGIMTWLKLGGSKWVLPLCYGVGTLIALLMVFVLINFLNSGTVTIKEGDLESTIRKWLYANHIDAQKIQLPNTIFAFQVKLSTRPYYVFRSNEQTYLLTINGTLRIDANDKAKLVELSPAKRQTILLELVLKLAELKIANNVNLMDSITVIQTLPIQDLTEIRLTDSLNNADFAIQAARTKFRLLLDAATP